jgi:hypothetical protein
MRRPGLAVALAVLLLAGCQTVHTTRDDGIPVAMWSSLLRTERTDRADRPGRAEGPDVRERVARVLKDAGIHATLDESGVRVPVGEDRRAREVLLTDKRLAGTDVIVFLAIPAGSGRRTEVGFEVPAVAPDEPVRMPGALGKD